MIVVKNMNRIIEQEENIGLRPHFSRLASLRQVMEQQAANGSSTLKNLIEQFAAEADPVARNALSVLVGRERREAANDEHYRYPAQHEWRAA